MGDALKRYVEKKYKEELRRLSSYWPAEYISLADARRGVRTIRLQTGETHTFEENEINLLLNTIPSYFHNLMKLPVTFRYTRMGGVARYRVLGDQWQRRLVEIILTGQYTYQGREELTVEEFIKLLRKYKSLVFVSVTL